MITKKYLDNLEYEIVGSRIEVHKALGTGLLESIYHKRLCKELRDFIFFEHLVPVYYKGVETETHLRVDF